MVSRGVGGSDHLQKLFIDLKWEVNLFGGGSISLLGLSGPYSLFRRKLDCCTVGGSSSTPGNHYFLLRLTSLRSGGVILRLLYFPSLN